MLFRRNDLRSYMTPEDEAPVEHAVMPPFQPERAAGTTRFLVGRHGIPIDQLLGPLPADETTLIMTAGHWSLHEMIDYVSSLIGPADMWLTTWGITAEPLKSLLRIQEQGRMRNLTMLFDSRVRTQCPQAYQLALGATKARIYYGKNHSKMAVLRNEQHAVLISTSANLTQNPRVESYVVITHRTLADRAIDIIEQVITRAEPFEAP
jgi:hypothetical protein